MRNRRVGPLRLVELLGEWSSGDAPLYAQLAAAVRQAIQAGDLRPGTRLPAERSLATTLAVSRTTVVTAFAHLKQEGYLDSAPGSGTWVRTVRGFSPAGGVATPTDTVGRNPLFSRLGQPSDGVVDLTVSALSPSPSVIEAIEEAGRKVGDHLEGAGYHSHGLPLLREAVARWFTDRGLPTVDDQILITNGGQQAIMLIASAFIQPGDPVVLESPTYPGALDAFRLVGATIRTVPVAPEGVSSEDVIRAVEARRPLIAYLIPTFQNPTGTVMTDLERKRLARFLSGRTTVVVEDESLVELSLTDEKPPRPLAAYQEAVLTVGSASKPFWGGLRVGWIRGPADTIRRLGHYKTVFDLGTPLTTQAAVCSLLDRGPEILAERRRLIGTQRSALEGALSALLPEWEWAAPAGGLSLWASIPEGSATELAQVALRHGVVIVPGPFFDPHSRHDQALRLPFVLSAGDLEQGIARLARAWAQYTGRSDLHTTRSA